MIYLILFVAILGTLLYKLFQLINSQFKKPQPEQIEKKFEIIKPQQTDLTEIYKDIGLEPYGCFTSLDEKFFMKQVNPYSKTNVFDSVIVISENRRTEDTKELIQRVMENGFDKYAHYILNKYEKDPEGYSKNMNIKEFAILGKLAGYNYLSVYKIDINTRGKIYLSYSPPMDEQLGFNVTKDEYNKNLTKSDLPDFTLTPKLGNYTNEKEKEPGKELSCGYPCLPYNKPMIFDDSGVTKQYMCGSVAYPDIKTPPRFAVYRIVEKS
jgi:hypothetical protein